MAATVLGTWSHGIRRMTSLAVHSFDTPGALRVANTCRRRIEGIATRFGSE
jgi:hypothetical protein